MRGAPWGAEGLEGRHMPALHPTDALREKKFFFKKKKRAKSPGLVFVSLRCAQARRMWFGGQRVRRHMKKKKKNSFDLIQSGSVRALPVAIGKSHEGKPGPRCLQQGAEGGGTGPVVAPSCSVGCYI